MECEERENAANNKDVIIVQCPADLRDSQIKKYLRIDEMWGERSNRSGEKAGELG